MMTLGGLNRLVSLDESGVFAWWDTQKVQMNDSTKLIQLFAAPDHCTALSVVIGGTAATKSYNGALIIAGSKKVQIFSCVNTRPQESAPVGVLYNHVFSVILTIHQDDIKIWDASQGTLQKVLHKPIEFGITVATFDDRHRKLLLCDQQGGIHVLNFLNGVKMKEFPAMPDHASQIVFVPIDKLFIVTSWSGLLRIYHEDCEPEESILREVAAHDTDIVALGFSRDLGLIATGDCRGIIRIWDFQRLTLECECISKLSGHEHVEITSLLFLDPWPLLAIGDSNGTISVVTVWSADGTRFSTFASAGMDEPIDDLPFSFRRAFESETAEIGEAHEHVQFVNIAHVR